MKRYGRSCSKILLLHVFVTEGVCCCKCRVITGFVIEAHNLIVIKVLNVGIDHVRLSACLDFSGRHMRLFEVHRGCVLAFGAFGCVERERERANGKWSSMHGSLRHNRLLLLIFPSNEKKEGRRSSK